MSQIRTEQFQFAHGKKPKGYGAWAFQARYQDLDIFWFTGMYSDAAKAARKHFGKYMDIKVCS